MASKAAKIGNPNTLDLTHDGDEPIFVKPADYDAFMLSQREAVEALRDRQKMISWLDEMKARIDNLFMDIAAWGKTNRVNEIIWGPRRDEGFFAIVAADEDPDGRLQDHVAELELELDGKYPFRLNFVLFRSEEAAGVASFISPDSQRSIYRAATSGTSR